MALAMEQFVHEEEDGDHPMRYRPIDHVYSSSTPSLKTCKVKTLPFRGDGFDCAGRDDNVKKPLVGGGIVGEKPVLVYKRRPKRARVDDSVVTKVEVKECDGSARAVGIGDVVDSVVEGFGGSRERLDSELGGGGGSRIGEISDFEVGDDKTLGSGERLDFEVGAGRVTKVAKRKRLVGMKLELSRLVGANGYLAGSSRHRLRACEGKKRRQGTEVKKHDSLSFSKAGKGLPGLSKVKKWVELELKDTKPSSLVGLPCKIFWSLDDEWYRGSVTHYDPKNQKYKIDYNDGDVEHLSLLTERIMFHISPEEMQKLQLKFGVLNSEKKGHDELLALAFSFHECQEVEPGALIWAKITGYAMWPAVVLNESEFYKSRHLKPVRLDRSILVQFFGTHDFARVQLKSAIPFRNGLDSALHLKCRQQRFVKGIEEAKQYLVEQQLPKSMLQKQKEIAVSGFKSLLKDEEGITSADDLSPDKNMSTDLQLPISPIEIGNLRVTNLGRVFYSSDHFHNKKFIWPEGYTAFRNFTSLEDPCKMTCYKMEVLRNPKENDRPLFRVTSDNGEQIDGPSPGACWKEIYNRIRNKKSNSASYSEAEGCSFQKSGSYMFGFSNPRISQLIQELPNSRLCSKYVEICRDTPESYKEVRVNWKDLDKCGVCDMDEEYEDNLFLQCDKCCMMVHAKCYGELEPKDGVLWLCNLCRPGAPKIPPRCCLCPVIGGAIKPTTDGRWAHLTCAMWIPETCLLDVKKMEPVDGISRINRDRWKLLCSICGVSYGACIQCSHPTCRVAYHPLCARAADLCFELADEEKFHLVPLEDDDQCIRLLSFCKKHRQPSNERSQSNNLRLPVDLSSSNVPSRNPSGCARCEPYNFSWRRGQRQPQVLSAASVKRSYVENTPYLVSGHRQSGNSWCPSSNEFSPSQSVGDGTIIGVSRYEVLGNACSMVDKYRNMKETFRRRLAFGKSKIHGFGVFAKIAHKAGDMIIEYIGELVRPPVADIRERRIYNSLVGAGTYMFRIDDERVIDATKAGSIAHLINHSCEPNCYSRVITVSGDEHIIIFAKREINQWEELTYDYRFLSIDERLPCYCGFPRCRGVVNDVEAEEQMAKIRVPLSELVPCKSESVPIQ